MMKPPVPSYSEVVTLLESYVDRNKMDAPAATMTFYSQKSNKNKKQHNTKFNNRGKSFSHGN